MKSITEISKAVRTAHEQADAGVLFDISERYDSLMTPDVAGTLALKKPLVKLH